MTDITKLAKGRDCLIRIPGRCNRNPETTVFCHYRMANISGYGFKSPPWLGAFGCSDCHDVCDGRAGSWIEYPQATRDLLLAEGVFRTMLILIDEGYIRVDGYEPNVIPKIVPRVVA